MPPKAKAKGQAKARARAALRRPAARVLRRPAALEDAAEDPWELGQEVTLNNLNALQLAPGCSLVVTEASYFGARIKLAGEVKKLEVDENGLTALLSALGTDSEELLKAQTARPGELFRCHICPPGCGQHETGEYFVHCLKGRRKRAEGDEPWTTSLKHGGAEAEEDEMRGLRMRSEDLARERGPAGGAPRHEAEVPGREVVDVDPPKDTKKKSKKKEKKKEKEVQSGRCPARAAQKEVKMIFGGTGLDPSEKIRRRVLGRAQRLASRKRRRSSSGGSSDSTSSSSPSGEDRIGLETVFTEETKIQAIAERYPGALTMESVSMMRNALLTTSGEQLEDKSVRPVALLYFRSVLAKKASGAQGRELLNISAALDQLLKGRPACAADILSQRLKAQESVCNGTHWAIALRMEVTPADVGGIAGRQELQEARKEDYAESRARWRAQASGPSKGDGKTKNKGSKGDKDAWRKDEKKGEGRDQGKGQEKK